MVIINLDFNLNQYHSCNLKGDDHEKRLIYLSKNIFGKATSVKQEEKKISLTFPYDKKIADDLTEFAFFEKNCCGNYKITIRYDMINQKINAELDMI